MSVGIWAQAQIAKMSNHHDPPGYFNVTVPIDSVETTMPFRFLFGLCADPIDKEAAHFVSVCYQRNIRDPIVIIVCHYLGIPPPEGLNLISGQGGGGKSTITRILTTKMQDAWMAHVRDWAGFEGPSPINITAVRMAGYLWLRFLRVPGQSWKPLTDRALCCKS